MSKAIVNPATFTTWDAMWSAVSRRLVDCPVPLIDDALKLAASEFFNASNVWRSPNMTLLTTVAAQTDYAVTPPTNADLNRVHGSWNGRTELVVSQPGDEGDDEPGITNASFKIDMRLGNVLTLTPAPDTDGVVIKGIVSYTTSDAAVGIPTLAWLQWTDEIACGAASFLVTQAQKPWSNPTSYAFLRSQFDNAIREASNGAGPVMRSPLRVTPW